MKMGKGLLNSSRFEFQKRSVVLNLLILLTFIASLLGPVTGARAQTEPPSAQVQAVLTSMTPEERVGQLFLVTFRLWPGRVKIYRSNHLPANLHLNNY